MFLFAIVNVEHFWCANNDTSKAWSIVARSWTGNQYMKSSMANPKMDFMYGFPAA